jgi:hypothetical protein
MERMEPGRALRRQVLYPPELHAHVSAKIAHRTTPFHVGIRDNLLSGRSRMDCERGGGFGASIRIFNSGIDSLRPGRT